MALRKINFMVLGALVETAVIETPVSIRLATTLWSWDVRFPHNAQGKTCIVHETGLLSIRTSGSVRKNITL